MLQVHLSCRLGWREQGLLVTWDEGGIRRLFPVIQKKKADSDMEDERVDVDDSALLY